MRILVLGGTAFVGRAVAAEAVRRGHEVTCAARGVSGDVPDGAELVRVDRREGLGPLVGAEFDAVVDLATMSYGYVRDALASLRAGHWTFVSSINVYADTLVPGPEVLDPVTDESTVEDYAQRDPAIYGAIKVACENAVRAAHPGAFVVRPGLITGPDDKSDRFGYWAQRMARGGRVLVPDDPEQSIQHVDVRDLVAWVLDAAEHGRGGTHDAIGPAVPLRELLTDLADAVAPTGTELVAAAPADLAAAGVQPWGGPKSLPLWLPDSHRGLAARDAGPVLAAGLPVRPLADTARAALETERARGIDRERRAGLTPDEEAELLRTTPTRTWYTR
ncbi:NAD-dependent epimerase/dehydratase family protein [Saccharopolyspora cebuensis]|uniref:NAD-dependent epimerase/dehydratase family protein n=1 Tax=Saccharopolyspora cebuensis TaxID=418759 RepID=A0ABV4CQM0_9PSEU